MFFYPILLAYLGTFLHLGISIFQGIPGLFTPFGAPAALVLFAYYIMSGQSARERLAALAAGAGLELARTCALHAGAAAGDKLPAIAFGFSYGFGLGFGFAVTLVLVFRELSRHCDPGLDPGEAIQPNCHAALVAASPGTTRRPRNKCGVTRSGFLPGLRRDRICLLAMTDKGKRLAALMAAQVFLVYSLHLVSVAAAVPYTVDDQLHRFELALGFYPAAEIALLYERFALFRVASYFAYDTLAGLVFAVWLLQWKQQPCPPVDLLAACALAAMLTVLYLVTPACGPRQVFGALFPHAIPATDFAVYMRDLDPKLLRNAMPSLHTVWVLLAWICAHYHQPARLPARIVAVFAILTLLATMGTGEHYFVDLVVAVPLALFTYALACFALPLRTRFLAIIAGISLATLWLLALCFAPGFFNIATAWGAIALTGGICLFLLHRLARSAESQRLQRAHASL